MTLNSVLLPAPLGPIKPQVWPSSTSKETPSSAVIPPKLIEISRIDRSGNEPGSAPTRLFAAVENGPEGYPALAIPFGELRLGQHEVGCLAAIPGNAWQLHARAVALQAAHRLDKRCPSRLLHALQHIYQHPGALEPLHRRPVVQVRLGLVLADDVLVLLH